MEDIIKRKISVLGSTGSIGTQTLECAAHLGLTVSAITGNRNVRLLEEQARRFRPGIVAVPGDAEAAELKTALADTPVRVLSGEGGLEEAAVAGDTVVTAIMGTAGLLPTMAAIKEKKRIALANKETLVCAGHIVMAAAREHGAEVIPVDSEHSAIFQSMAGGRKNEVKRILLTASGGPFFGMKREDMVDITPEQALKHPNWTMGAKITIDSATMMNKGLEVIEAMHLFSVTPEMIKVVVHRQSIIHSMVQFCDNTVIAQLGTPDMRTPIQYALTYPRRLPSLAAEPDFADIGGMTFFDPDLDAFPCLRLALETAGRTDAAPAVMNAANEVAVELFLRKKLSFPGIYDAVAQAVAALGAGSADTIEDTLARDAEAREFIRRRYD